MTRLSLLMVRARIKAYHCIPRLLVFCLFVFLFFFSIYEIYCQIGFHTTPNAHPKRCPPQYPSPTPHQPSVCSQFLTVSYALALSHSNLFFFLPSPPPWVPVKFLRIHIRVKPYGICLSLYGLFHLA